MSLQITRKNNINVIGSPDAATTLVFGHGFGTDQTAFREVAAAFEKEYRIVLFDNVGGGKSDMQAYSPDRYKMLNGYAMDLTDILRFLQMKEVVYIGHSVSGMVGVLAAIEQPQYFSKLVLLGASPRYLNDAATGYIGGFEPAHLEDVYSAMRTNYQAWANGFSAMAMNHPERPELAASFAQGLSELRPDIALHVAKAIFESDHREALSKVKMPVLIIQTREDIAVPAPVAPYMQKHMANSTLMKVNTKGHFPHMSAPAEVIAAIQQFLQLKPSM